MYEIEVLIPEVAFKDSRGTIKNLLQQTAKNIAIIWSADQAVRGNHVHQKGGHWEYVISGVITIHRVVDGKPISRSISSGDMVYTPPGVPHALSSEGLSAILHILEVPLEEHDKDTEKVKVI